MRIIVILGNIANNAEKQSGIILINYTSFGYLEKKLWDVFGIFTPQLRNIMDASYESMVLLLAHYFEKPRGNEKNAQFQRKKNAVLRLTPN